MRNIFNYKLPNDVIKIIKKLKPCMNFLLNLESTKKIIEHLNKNLEEITYILLAYDN